MVIWVLSHRLSEISHLKHTAHSMWRLLVPQRGELGPNSLLLSACRQLAQAYHTSPPCPGPSPAQPTEPPSSSPATPSQPSTQSTIPSASPLQSLRQQLAQIDEAASPDPDASGDRPHFSRSSMRTWKWYDHKDEKEWQKRELQRQYTGAGIAHMRNVPTGMKKMDRILRLVRGLHYEEAVRQCKALPHKSARYAEEALDHALEDAMEKGLDENKLVVDTVYCTKGEYLKETSQKGKGHATQLIHRRCHVLVQLRELDLQYQGFRARTLPPVTLVPPPPPPVTRQQQHAPPAPLLFASKRVPRHRQL